MEAIATIITKRLIASGVIEDVEIDIYLFGFTCLLSTSLQWAVLVIMAAAFGRVGQIALVAICFKGIKSNCGGWHCSSKGICFVTTTGLLLVLSQLAMMVPEEAAALLASSFALSACILIFLRAPIVHPNNPKTVEEYIAHKKMSRILAMAMALAILTSLLYVTSPLFSLPVSAAAGMFAAAVTLLIPVKKEVQR